MKHYRWIFLMFLAAAAIHVTETLYRIRFFGSFFSWQAQICLQPLYYLAGWCLFWGFRKAQTFLSGWAVFIFFIVISRTLINFYVGEPWNFRVILGLFLLVYGLFLTIQTENKGIVLACGGGLIAWASVVVFDASSRALWDGIVLSWWMFYLLAAAAAIAVHENISRRAVFDRYFSWRAQRVMLPISLIINCGLFYGYREAMPSFIFAWAVYTLYDTVIRIVNNKLLGEPFRTTHAFGMAAVIAGTALAYIGGLR